MGNKAWMVYVAYAVLVIGSGAALFMAERPLSTTVVTLALFSFNLAAIIFIAPAVMGYLSRLKENAEKNDSEILMQLKEIRARLSLLNGGSPSQQIPLQGALAGTAAATNMTARSIQKAPAATSAQMPVKSSTTTAANSYTSATLSHLRNAVPINSVSSIENVKPPLTETPAMDHIFGKPHAPVLHRPQPSAPMNFESSVTTNTKPLQTDLFGHSTPAPASSPLSSQLPIESEPTHAPSTQAPAHLTTPPPAFSLFSSTHESPTPSSSAATTPTSHTIPAADISIVVSAVIGEDDVLCIRGEGASGLNWQEGLPMSYDGNDRWRWTASAQSQPITCRIYLNDEISAFGDDVVLQPGQTIEVSPTFPQIEA